MCYVLAGMPGAVRTQTPVTSLKEAICRIETLIGHLSY